MNERDMAVLKHIVRYCDEIEEAKTVFGDSLEMMKENNVYKNAAAMCIIQIGELTTHLSEGFKTEHSHIPWRDIKGMRNIAAHHYGRFDSQKLFETITEDIPALREFCSKIIGQ